MMKKKNVAMAMAATMVASAVAPVVANAAEYQINADSTNTLITELKKLLRETYIEDGKALTESIYDIAITSGATTVTADTINEITLIEDALELAKNSNTSAEIKVIKKAVTKLDNGDIIKEEVPKYEENTDLIETERSISGIAEEEINTTSGHVVTSATAYDYNKNQLTITLGVEYAITTGATTAASIIEDLNNSAEGIKVTSAATDGDVTTAAITKEIKVKVGDEKVKVPTTNANDFNVVLKNGKTKALKDITATALTATASTTQYKDAIQTIITELSKIDRMESVDAVSSTTTDIATITVNPHEQIEIVKATDLLDNGILTSKGQELVRAIGTTYKKTSGSVTSSYTVEIKDVSSIKEKSTTAKAKTYYIDVEVVGTRDDSVEEPLTKLTIESTNRDEVVAVRNMLLDVKEGDTVKVVDELSGATRFETAIEISKQTVTGSTNNVVLVGENAIVDGLAAGPLAASLNTSILLTNKDEVKANVMDEIKRVLNIEGTLVSNLKNKTVYLVGGEAVIGEGVVEQLEELGITVERVAGETRYETSMEIADLVLKNEGISSKTNAYVVGGNGLADAMSISAKASNELRPIIVVEKDGIDSKTLKSITEDFNEVDIIGGTAVVSENVESQLVDKLGNNKVERVAGETREETNAKVITKYHRGANKLYVANNGFVKDIAAKGDDQLIDAMTVAPLAANNNAPIVLVGNELSAEQQEAIELRIASQSPVTKVGGAVVKTIVEKVGKLVGLVK